MKCRLSKRKIGICIPVAFIISYSFLYGLKFLIFGNTSIIFFMFLFVALTLVAFNLHVTLKRADMSIDIVCIVCLLIILLNRNKRFHAGNYLFDSNLVLMFFIYLYAKRTSLWHSMAIKLIIAFGLFYVISTLYLFVFPDVYISRVAPLFGGTYMYSMIRKANSGYAVGFANHYSTTAIYLSTAVGIFISYIMRNDNKQNRALPMVLALLATADIFQSQTLFFS